MHQMIKKRTFAFLCLALALVLGVLTSAQQKVGVYVGEVKGPDEFVSERIRLLFMEEFSKIKMLEVVDSKDKAQLILDGIARVESGQEAVLSVKLSEPGTSRIVFAGNKSSKGSASGAIRDAVVYMVLDMKKALKWK